MGWFSCTHEPMVGLSGTPEVKTSRRYYKYLGYRSEYRVQVTTHVCRHCNVVYVTQHEIDEISAAIGPAVSKRKSK